MRKAPSRQVSSMRRDLALVLEVAAVLLIGLMAGFFFAFAVDVAPAMAQLEGLTLPSTPCRARRCPPSR